MQIDDTSSQHHIDAALRSTLDINNILDMVIKSSTVIIFLKNGARIEAKLTHELKKLYWDVKLRNRRKAFGL